LKMAGISAVATANNHAYDYKMVGLRETIGYLRDAGVMWIGTSADSGGTFSPIILDKKGIRVGFLAYTQFVNRKTGWKGHVSLFDRVRMKEDVAVLRPKVDLVRNLARAAGIGGMVGGQALDLAAERDAPDEAGIIRLQAMKTGALIRFACEAGAIAAGAAQHDVERLAEFGSAIGLAFQLADDLLDHTSTPPAMGKATGKDAAAGKATLVALHGEDWARRQLDGLVTQACDLLAPYGERAVVLAATARFVAERNR